MLETIIIILVLLWLVGYFGKVSYPIFSGNLLHALLVIAVVVLIIRLL
jgi:hypothetical protein